MLDAPPAQWLYLKAMQGSLRAEGCRALGLRERRGEEKCLVMVHHAAGRNYRLGWCRVQGGGAKGAVG